MLFVANPKPGETRLLVRVVRNGETTARDVGHLDFLPVFVGINASPDERSLLVTLPGRGTDLLLVNDFR